MSETRSLARSLTNTHTEWNFLPRPGAPTKLIKEIERNERKKLGARYMPQQQLSAPSIIWNGAEQKKLHRLYHPLFLPNQQNFLLVCSQPFWMWHFMANFEILYPSCPLASAACIIKLLGWLLFSIGSNILKPLKATFLPTHKTCKCIWILYSKLVSPQAGKRALTFLCLYNLMS